MIQRHITNGVIGDFDFFNDSDDTITWLKDQIANETDPLKKKHLSDVCKSLKEQTEKWWAEKTKNRMSKN